ncbi:MAG: gliding motility-associated C-terminal domain-containing protein [Saprospiraceae bacterium]|nr:gliding motility-associated C-terminal domain-containing protein [Saprospiraceae bacterium]
MHKLLIPLLVCLSATLVHAQVPKNISFNPKSVPVTASQAGPDGACNAGTVSTGAFFGQSNDHDLDTIFLCLGDSIFIDHNGDNMFMDPDPLTTPGIGYAFYNCMPTGTGDLPTVLADPCVWPGSANGIWVATGPGPAFSNGDFYFVNNGNLIAGFIGGNNPVLITFAPITLDNYDNQGFEGGCVDVNVNAKFSVVYLKAITESGIDVNFQGADCKGKFRLRGGYPEWDANGRYSVTISLASDPNVRALIYTPPAQMKHGTDVIFSVPQSGVYNVYVEDGKSCGLTFQIAMNACDASDNVILAMPEVAAPPGSQICVPLSSTNFTNIVGSSFSINWDPTVLQYVSIQNLNPQLGQINVNTLFNEQNTPQGFLGFVYSDFSGTGASIPSGQTMFDMCFLVLGPLDSCSTLDIGSFPSIVTMDNATEQLSVTVDTGAVCANLIPLVVNFYVDNPNCNNTASIGAIITGGSPNYDVSWRLLPSGAPLSVTALLPDTILTNPLPEGDWEVCVTDGAGTMVCDTLTISIPSLGATLGIVQLPSCFGSTDGIVEAQVSIDGILVPSPAPANYTFAWTGGATSQQLTDVAAGNYTVVVTDTMTGCTALASGTLSQPADLSSNIQLTPASCNGVPDGCITSTASGGTPFPGGEYFYSWEFSPNLSGTPLFTDESGNGAPDFTMCDKPAGIYFLTVTDGNGCTKVFPDVVLTNLRNVHLDTLAIVNPSCFGTATGSVEAQLNAEPAFVNGDYLFFWAPGPFPQVNTGNTSEYTMLPAGMYGVVAIEVTTGCSDTASFKLVDPPAVAATTTQVNPTCQNQTSGSINVTASGGTGSGYTYVWTSVPPVAIGNTPTPTGLAAGTYTVVVTDANGCSTTTSTQLNLPAPPAIADIDSTSVKCGADGTLTVTAPTAVSFAWTTLSGQPVGTTAQVTGLPGDTYIITIRDAQNCINMDTVTLAPVLPAFFADTLLQQPKCAGDMDGSIAIDVQGGTQPYQYNWSGGQNTSVLFPISAGTYTVTVTDGNLCTTVGTFVLTNPAPIAVAYNNIVGASCPNTCDGQVILVAYYNSNPPVFANFNFQWEDGSVDSIRTDLCAGYNTVTITDPQKGCSKVDSLLITSPTAMTASFDTIPATCFGDSDGEATVMVSGGSPNPVYSYNWSSGGMLAHVTGLDAGQYTLTVTDNGSGCTQVFTTNVTQPNEVIVQKDLLLSENIGCFGEKTGKLEVTSTGGNPGPFTFNWSDGTNNLGMGNPLTDLGAGEYFVTATDSKGCTGTLPNLILSDPPPVQGTIDPFEPLLCNGDETIIMIGTITGGAGEPYQYSLDFGVYLDPTIPISVGGGVHYITYQDRQGCEYTDTITIPEPDEIFVTFDPNEVEIELGDTTFQLLPIVTGAVVDSFTWTHPELLRTPADFEPYAQTFETTTYTIVVSDEKGCTASGTITVNIDPNRNVYVPNVFHPGNPKGINDHFNPIVGLGVEKVNYMRIYDRWGTQMYEREEFFPDNNNFAEGWDGRYKGDYVNPAVFIYVIEVSFLDGRVLLYRGDVTVIR